MLAVVLFLLTAVREVGLSGNKQTHTASNQYARYGLATRNVKQQTIRPETALHNDVFITVEPVTQASHKTVLDLLQG